MAKYLKLITLPVIVLLVSGNIRLNAAEQMQLKADVSSNVSPIKPIDIGSRLELFADDYLIEKLTGAAELRLHQPEPKEIAIIYDAPWEGSGSGYVSVFKDGDTYRMYYKAWQLLGSEDVSHDICCCYAESNDGIHWDKPNLGLYEFKGSKQNNIVFINGTIDGVEADGGHPAVFRDENPNVPSDERYKAILVAWNSPSQGPWNSPNKGLVVFKSHDGIHWLALNKAAVITDGMFDSQNLAFWDDTRGEYRAYWRTFTKRPTKLTAQDTDDQDAIRGYEVRSIRTARSKDMIHWYDYKDVEYIDSPLEQLYTSVVKPYYRAPHLYLGFPTRYIDRGWSESIRMLPELEEREYRAFKDKNADERYGTAITEGLFMVSRDGVLFRRWNEAFLRPGIERKGSWAYGNQYIAWSMVETKSSLEGAPNELSFYAVESFWTGTSSALRRYTLRIDGFVSISAPMKGGELITRPLTFSGDKLHINFASSAVGDIRVEIQDEAGNPVPGFTLKDCLPVYGDSLERIVVWKNGSNLLPLKNRPVRLRFVLKDADLYSIQFK